jgi:hypothetical protein
MNTLPFGDDKMKRNTAFLNRLEEVNQKIAQPVSQDGRFLCFTQTNTYNLKEKGCKAQSNKMGLEVIILDIKAP